MTYSFGKGNVTFLNLIVISIYVGMKSSVNNMDAHQANQYDKNFKYAVSFPADIPNELMVFYD